MGRNVRTKGKENAVTFETFADGCYCNEDGTCAFWMHKFGECDDDVCPRYDDFILSQEQCKKETHFDSLEHNKREEGII